MILILSATLKSRLYEQRWIRVKLYLEFGIFVELSLGFQLYLEFAIFVELSLGFQRLLLEIPSRVVSNIVLRCVV